MFEKQVFQDYSTYLHFQNKKKQSIEELLINFKDVKIFYWRPCYIEPLHQEVWMQLLIIKDNPRLNSSFATQFFKLTSLFKTCIIKVFSSH